MALPTWHKLWEVFRREVGQVLARLYTVRHPGVAEMAVFRALSSLLARLVPNDRWSLQIHLAQWMKTLGVPALLPVPVPRRVFMLAAYRIEFTWAFVIAVLLAWRGHSVTVGYFPKLRSPIKLPLADHQGAAAYLERALSKLECLSHGRIRAVDLSQVVPDESEIDEAFLKSQTISDVVMRLQRETVDLSDPDAARAWDYYTLQARRAQAIANAFFSRNRGAFDLCVLANGTTFEAAQFLHAAQMHRLPVNVYEKFAFRNIRVLNHGGDFRQFDDLELAWSRRRELGYLAEPFFSAAVARARSLIGERRRSSTDTWAWKLQSAPEQSAREALGSVGLGENERFVLVCPNIPYDAGYDGLLGAFSSMSDWLQETVRHLLRETDLRVVVRAHPGEAIMTSLTEKTENILAEFASEPRLTILGGGMKVNTYGLIEHCAFGVVFSSTTGMEMAALGREVVVGARVYYANRGFTRGGITREEYFAAIRDLAALREVRPLAAECSDLACLFHFILHFVLQWPFPYNKPSDVADLPPYRLAADPGMDRYLPFLDALTLPPAEWSERITEYLAADGDNHIPKPAGERTDAPQLAAS